MSAAVLYIQEVSLIQLYCGEHNIRISQSQAVILFIGNRLEVHLVYLLSVSPVPLPTAKLATAGAGSAHRATWELSYRGESVPDSLRSDLLLAVVSWNRFCDGCGSRKLHGFGSMIDGI
jgi:hypothetical protein